MRLCYFFLLNALCSFSIFLSAAQSLENGETAESTAWAENTLQQMSQDEKIGQLFMIAGYIDPEYARLEIGNPNIIQEIDSYITKYNIGGIAFVGPSESEKQVVLINHYQEISKYPILTAQDLEWGLSMRLKDGLVFPKNSTLGAISDNQLIYEMGKEIGNQAKCIGVHMNLSPVLDVNIEPENIVINVRSFGSSPKQVAEKGVAMIRGLQDAGIIASAKHFPGLGDITVDPHLALPANKQGLKRLEEVELYPFAEAIKAGVLSIQTEHLLVPTLESDPRIPASLSSAVVNDLLREKLGFKGLVISGALRMKALTNYFSDEEIILRAFSVSDMLLMPQDFPKAFNILKSALASGKINQEDIDKRVLKILQMKEKVKLDRQRIVAIPTQEQLHSPYAQQLKKQLYRGAISWLRQKIPLDISKETPVAYVQLGDAPIIDFSKRMSYFDNVDSYSFALGETHKEEEQRLMQQINKYAYIFLAVYPADPRRIAQIRLLNKENQEEELKQFSVHGITPSILRVRDLLKPYENKTVVVFFGNSFGVHFFNDYSTLLMAYETDSEAQNIAADILFYPPGTKGREEIRKNFK